MKRVVLEWKRTPPAASVTTIQVAGGWARWGQQQGWAVSTFQVGKTRRGQARAGGAQGHSKVGCGGPGLRVDGVVVGR